MFVEIGSHMLALVRFASIAPCPFQGSHGEDFCVETARKAPRPDVAPIVGTLLLERADSFIDHVGIDQGTIGGDTDDGPGLFVPSAAVIAIEDIHFTSAVKDNSQTLAFGDDGIVARRLRSGNDHASDKLCPLYPMHHRSKHGFR